jgi:hypothetical protein
VGVLLECFDRITAVHCPMWTDSKDRVTKQFRPRASRSNPEAELLHTGVVSVHGESVAPGALVSKTSQE